MKIFTERIWTISQNGEFTTRSGQLQIDQSDAIYDLRDAKRNLYISEGLEPRDLAVFLKINGRYGGDNSDKEETLGYLVGKVNKEPFDGSGIIVSGDKVNQDPSQWGNKRIFSGWSMLEKIYPNICEDFGLNGLYKYIKSLETNQ